MAGGIEIFLRTVRSRITEIGLKSRVSAKKPNLQANHVKIQL